MTDSPRLPGRSALVVLFAVAVCALLAAATLTAVVIAGDGPEPSIPAASGPAGNQPSPSPSPRQTTSRPAGPPMCLIGTWRTVDESFMLKFYSDQPPMPFAQNGRVFEFRPDGTGTARHDNVAATASWRGRALRLVTNGTYEFTWTATDRQITYHARPAAAATWDYYDHRGHLETQRMQPDPELNEVDDYTCQGAVLTEGNQGGYRSRMTRVAGFGMYG